MNLFPAAYTTPSSSASPIRIVHSAGGTGLQAADAHLLLDPAFPYGEDLLQFIWEQRLYEPRGLCTTDGRPVEVLHPGRIQRHSGPDLDGAQVRIDGQLWAGTVEVHLRSSEWVAHGHQHDPAYESVVLHVVFEHDAEVHARGGRRLPTIELMPRVRQDSIAMHLALMRGQGWVPCASLFPLLREAPIGPWLERLVVERLERKTLAVEALSQQLGGDMEGTLHHMLLRGLGMKVNAEPFGMLGHALPLALLWKYRDDEIRTEALLFGQAGLLQVDHVDEYPRELRREYLHLARLHSLHPMPVAAWKFARMRPVNFPTVRIAQFARLLMRCDGSYASLIETDDLATLYGIMDVEAGPYWSDHYLFDRPSSRSPKRLGRTAVHHLLINALVPTLFAQGRKLGRPRLVERALSLLEQLPPERNHVLDGWDGVGLRADSAARGQALIELRHSYCSAKRCLSCGIGNQLLRRTV